MSEMIIVVSSFMSSQQCQTKTKRMVKVGNPHIGHVFETAGGFLGGGGVLAGRHEKTTEKNLWGCSTS